MKQEADPFEQAIERLEPKPGVYVASIAACADGWYKSDAHYGLPYKKITFITDKGFTTSCVIGDFLRWASGKDNFVRSMFMRAIGLTDDDEFPDMDYLQNIEVVVTLEQQDRWLNVKSIKPFQTDAGATHVKVVV